ncbi:BMP family ABC transporter substrate-binding protein [Pseudoroseicyclus tamaricis]|uniref:BMP family ABC transporter substrate-binding protein n=1 Tax=Pseudoroseicyclus tamaricis TaxID=2705421 RepID=A0A6B2JYS9_9RHOB|nr:BMP family ABC transporter substrate-binding protein [Pseudoroseicyclus tamaricis]NDV00522.1 BMP family ABC transporter substrate-binding protein [Pseudoroseicyclus tamaricis]
MKFPLAAASLLALSAPVSAQEYQSIIYVSPNPVGINDFLQLGADGTMRIAEEMGLDAKIFESSDPTVKLQNLEAAAQEADIVVAITFEFDEILADVARDYPETQFLQVDSCTPDAPENVHCSVFREYETAFLAGAVAALTSETGTIGAIGALDIPFIHRYTDAFIAGAEHVMPEIEVAPTLWIGGDNPFADPARGQQRATIMASGGADRILTAASGTNGGVFRALEDFPGAAGFGVDINQCLQAPGVVMDNIEKNTDIVVEMGVRGIIEGTQPAIVALGLADEGMTLTSLKPGVEDSECLIANYPEVIEQVAALRDQIVAGELEVADPMQMAE